MPESSNQIKKVIMALVVIVVVLGVAASFWFKLPRGATSTPNSQHNNPIQPTFKPLSVSNRIISGMVTNVTLSDDKIVLGAYRVENNKAILASQSTVYYTSETVFSREVESQSGSSSVENKISPRDIKIGEAAMIVVSGASSADRLVAEKVMILLPPPPPRNRK